MSLYGEYYLSHHGVKGMKWGVRKEKYVKKDPRQARKDVNRLFRIANNRKTGIGAKAASAAASVGVPKEKYESAYQHARTGRWIVDARFKKNLAQQSVDVYLRSSKPIVRMRLENGEKVVYEWINENDRVNAEAFINYCNGRMAEEE